MTTAFNINDTLPKDLGGQKFGAWVNNSGSIAEFNLPHALGASTNNSYKTGYLGVATNVQAQTITSTAPGLAIGGVYLETQTASPVSSGKFKIAQITGYGEILSTGAYKTASRTAGSVETYKTTSAILYGAIVAGAGVTAGNSVKIQNGTIDMIGIVFGAANQTMSWTAPDGGISFSTSLKQTTTISGGAASVTLIYR